MILRAALLVLLLVASALPARAVESVLTLTPRPGATLRVLVDRPAAPVGSVVLMAGGDGVLDFDAQGNIGGLRENHLVRTRAAYVKAGYAVFVPDIASDQRGTRGYRYTVSYASDVAAVVAEARKVAPPVAIVGTSRSSLPVVAVFVKQSAVRPDAAVISSGTLLGNEGGGSASSLGNLINVPVMLLRHRLDSCRVSAPADADRFKALLTGAPRVDIVTLEGGGPRSSSADACGASRYHGFYGIDDQAVAATVQWRRPAVQQGGRGARAALRGRLPGQPRQRWRPPRRSRQRGTPARQVQDTSLSTGGNHGRNQSCRIRLPAHGSAGPRRDGGVSHPFRPDPRRAHA